MRQTKTIDEGNSKLILIFSGWASSPILFEEYKPQGYDLMICYDYHNINFDFEMVEDYKEIIAIGWSMGVWVGTHILGNIEKKRISSAIAINGSPYQVDDHLGIPKDIFLGTAENLNEKNLHKFIRRMCGSTDMLKHFLKVTPRRELEDIKGELLSVEDMYNKLGVGSFRWDKAIIAKEDKIITADNQKRAWETLGVPYEFVDSSHYDNNIFQKYLVDLWTKD